MKKQGILENQANIVYLGIGSNLGNKKLNIEKAKYYLSQEGLKILKSSSFYETPSWPNNKFPKYYNIIIKAITSLSLLTLFLKIKKIEKRLGRTKKPKNYPRKCDIDIIDFNQKNKRFRFKNHNIEIPHPRMQNRNFVLIPLFEISKKWQHPKNNQKIVNLLSKLDNKNLRTIKFI